MVVDANIAHSCFSLVFFHYERHFQHLSSSELSKHQQGSLTTTSASLYYHLPRVYQLKPEQVLGLESAVGTSHVVRKTFLQTHRWRRLLRRLLALSSSVRLSGLRLHTENKGGNEQSQRDSRRLIICYYGDNCSTLARARVPRKYAKPPLHQCAEPSLFRSVSTVLALAFHFFSRSRVAKLHSRRII